MGNGSSGCDFQSFWLICPPSDLKIVLLSEPSSWSSTKLCSVICVNKSQVGWWPFGGAGSYRKGTWYLPFTHEGCIWTSQRGQFSPGCLIHLIGQMLWSSTGNASRICWGSWLFLVMKRRLWCPLFADPSQSCPDVQIRCLNACSKSANLSVHCPGAFCPWWNMG